MKYLASSKEISNFNKEDNFKNLQNPFGWFFQSIELWCSSNCIEKCIENEIHPNLAIINICNQWSLLRGFAIENIIKGIIISLEPSLIKEKRLNDQISNHQLKSLCTKANISLDKWDEELIDHLDQSIMINGRYPCAITSDMQKREYIYKFIPHYKIISDILFRELLFVFCKINGYNKESYMNSISYLELYK